MRLFAKSLVGDGQMLDAHFVRWTNAAYRIVSRDYVIPKLNAGDSVTLKAVTGSTQKYYLPYDFQRVISFFDDNYRSLDVLPSEDVRQYGEYNSLGSFVQFYEYTSTNITPLAESGATPVLIAIPNRSTTVTASGGTPFTSAMATDGEWILPIDRNTAAGAANPEDYGYKIATFTSTTVVVLARPFRGTLSDGGSVGSLTTGYFEVRPRNTPIVRIWGDPGTAVDINLEYQRKPSKLANDEDTPEEDRLSESLTYMAIDMAGWRYREAFMAKRAQNAIAQTLSSFEKSKDYDKRLIHNYITGNPNGRSYSQIAGNRLGSHRQFSHRGIRY